MLSETEDTDVRQFYDLSTNEIYELPLPQARGRKILGSAHGWLITVGKDGEFHVLNPLTGIQIALPPMSTFQSVKECPKEFTPQQVRDLFAIKATLSANPSNGDDFVVMVVNLGFNTTCLSFCRPSDVGWMNFQQIKQHDLDFVGEQFYSITWAGSIFACHASPQPWMVKIATIPQANIGPLACYTVECGGELIVIKRSLWINQSVGDLSGWDGTCYRTNSFKVYKLDLEDASLHELQNIGDHALFVGNNNAICLPATSDIKAYKRNSIYFTDDYHEGIFAFAEHEGGLDMGVYSLDDGSIQPHYPGVSKSKFSLPIWVVPNSN